MIDFKDVTFIVPLRFDSEDRRRNFKTSMDYILRNFKTNIIILDSDKKPNEEFVKGVSKDIKYIFEKNNDKLFHRTRLLNDMTRLCQTDIIVNYDVDVVFPINQYIEARKRIKEGSTMCFPYSGKFYDIPVKFFNHVTGDTLTDIPLNQCTLFNPNSVGGAFFFHKGRYGEIGWENENFVSWGHEDWERIVRVEKMDYEMCRVEGILYHLTHSRTSNSSDKNPYYQFNGQEFHKIKNMGKEQLGNYIKTWGWL